MKTTEKAPAIAYVKQDVISRCFNDDDKPDVISNAIAQSLEAWFAGKNEQV